MKDYHHTPHPIGAFLTGALVATAIWGYFLFGSKKSFRNRKKVERWMEDAREEVLATTKKMKNLTEDTFYDTIDKVLSKYAKLKNVANDKIDEIRTELRDR
jgi:hypothetical protein